MSITDEMRNKWRKRIDYCLDCNLEKWEYDFICSILNYLNKFDKLTPAQVKYLYQIYHRYDE